MKTHLKAFAIAIAAWFGTPGFADSPLTSTYFFHVFKGHPIIQHALYLDTAEDGNISERLMEFLAAPSEPLYLKMAAINALGWNHANKGHANAPRFIHYLMQKRQYADTAELLDRADAADLLCIAYLAALDHYHRPTPALPYTQAALTKDSQSFTVQMIAALIEAQILFDASWCLAYERVASVYLNSEGWEADMPAEAAEAMWHYMSEYRRICAPDDEPDYRATYGDEYEFIEEVLGAPLFRIGVTELTDDDGNPSLEPCYWYDQDLDKEMDDEETCCGTQCYSNFW